MKNAIILTMSVLIALTFGCKKNNGGAGSAEIFVKGTVDGKVFDCTNLVVSETAIIDQNSKNTTLSIIARKGSAQDHIGFDFQITPFKGVGKYPAASLDYQVLTTLYLGLKPEDGYTVAYDSSTGGFKGSGMVEITSVEGDMVRGKFEFTGFNTSGATKTISNGSFAVKVKKK